MTIYEISDDNIEVVHRAESAMESALDNWGTEDMNTYLEQASELFEQAGLLDSSAEALTLIDPDL